MSNLATNALAFVIVLGFLVFAHESGHFFFAKLFRVRVLVFSFGFGKRLFGFRKGDTDYRVSLIPLGGYVRMAGDIPEEARSGDPDEFLSRPKWQRFLILFAGPLMNLLIAIGFLTGLNMVGNEILRESRPVLGLVVPGKPAARAGLKEGDLIVQANNEKIVTWEDLKLAISMNPNARLNIDFIRNGRPAQTVLIPEKQENEYGISGFAGIQKFVSSEIGRVAAGGPAQRAGMEPGDHIVAVNGKPIAQLNEFDEQLEKAKAPLKVTLRRDVRTFDTVFPLQRENGELDRGFIPPTVIRKLDFPDALRESIDQNWKMARYAAVVLSRLFRLQGSVKEFQGPISIARISGEMLRTGWKAMIYLMASISLQLGIMNLLPVPVLDGGHIAILVVEGAARRDLSLRVKERIQQLGFAALAMLMIVVLFNDVIQNVLLWKKG
ncbi:MAG TPA: site-2 protease family protein [Thermoanaerobaculia bacterium]|nr:site-2 protease family protein [Thermoanaerobaculia bacterium]